MTETLILLAMLCAVIVVATVCFCIALLAMFVYKFLLAGLEAGIQKIKIEKRGKQQSDDLQKDK